MNRIFLGLAIRGSGEAAWKLSRVGPRGRQAHPQRQAHRVSGLGARPVDPGTDQFHKAQLRVSRLRLMRKSRYRKFPGRPRVGGTYVAGPVWVDWTRRRNFTSDAGRTESRAGQDPRILDRAAFERGVVTLGEKGDRPPHGADLHTRACPLRRNATTGRSAREQRA